MRVMPTVFVMHSLCGAKKAFQKINFYYDFFVIVFKKTFNFFITKERNGKFKPFYIELDFKKWVNLHATRCVKLSKPIVMSMLSTLRIT